MHLSTLLPTAVLALAPTLAAARGQSGFALGNKTPAGECKAQQDFEDDFDAISAASQAKVVRIYAASDCDVAKNILPAAKAKGFQVMLGIWPDTDDSFSMDRDAVTKYAPQYPDQVYAITVGSEALYRGDHDGPWLAGKIQEVKKAVPQFKVGTADSWNKFADGTADTVIQGGADVLLCNGFSYWQGQPIANATATFFDDMYQAFGHIQKLSGGADKAPELWVGETGWPSDGLKYQNAEPGVDAAATFYAQGFCGIVDWGFNAFFFEAFDEPWKPDSKGQDGTMMPETHWGAMNADRSAKYNLKC